MPNRKMASELLPAISSPPISSGEIALARAEWQSIFFSEWPARLDLLKLQVTWPLTPLRIRVHRNHAFEHVADVASRWFAWWGRDAQVSYSDYDDSLSFRLDDSQDPHLELVWLDLQHYAQKFTPPELAPWLSERLTTLRSLSSAPIALALIGAPPDAHEALVASSRTIAGLRVVDLGPIQQELGQRFFDERAAKFSGTRLSNPACLRVARELACRWAPSLTTPPIKAVALDLDHTLYEGVLGEDGTQVRLTPGHLSLQQHLLALREKGVFLALTSRNEEPDVRRLFTERSDFPLRWEHFSATSVNWGSKGESLRQVAQSLRIGLDAILFVDDNPGELASVAAELPSINTLHAASDTSVTLRALQYYPGLWRWERSATDTVRVADLDAEPERARLAAAAANPEEYLRSLRVSLRIEVNPRPHLARMHELTQKTNQFNLNLERCSEAELAELLASPDHRLAVIALSDRLSDSGLVGLVVASREAETLVIREVAISCRALGRRLEDLMIASAVRALLQELPSPRVEFLHRSGPRNAPARQWLSQLVSASLPEQGRSPAHTSLSRIRAQDYPVEVAVIHHEFKRD